MYCVWHSDPVVWSGITSTVKSVIFCLSQKLLWVVNKTTQQTLVGQGPCLPGLKWSLFDSQTSKWWRVGRPIMVQSDPHWQTRKYWSYYCSGKKQHRILFHSLFGDQPYCEIHYFFFLLYKKFHAIFVYLALSWYETVHSSLYPHIWWLFIRNLFVLINSLNIDIDIFGQKYCDIWFCCPVLPFMTCFWWDF